MSKREIALVAAACILGGIVMGFLLAPIKGGISCANNNTITGDAKVDPKQPK